MRRTAPFFLRWFLAVSASRFEYFRLPHEYAFSEAYALSMVIGFYEKHMSPMSQI
jgi:hypothetical protein